MQLRVFLSELKRRQVYRAMLIYATIAWVLLEGADIVFPRLGFADESITLVLILVCIGFPIALYLAWVFDITPDGIFRTTPLTPGTSHHFSWVRIAEFLAFGGLIIAVGYLYMDRLSLQQRVAEPGSEVALQTQDIDPSQYRSIAVLPFADMSEAGDQAWFAEGIAEELLLALSKVKPLLVVARTSSFAFKDTDKTVAEIADILNVQAVLEGSVRHSGGKVRVTAQLVDASSGYHLWSGGYEREPQDIFRLQDEMAKSIVGSLLIELGIEASTHLVAEQTREPAAYNWFMRGRALMDWADQEHTRKSINYFENAVNLDPDYAQAWGYLAWARANMSFWQPTAEAVPGAREAYTIALELDPTQAEALTAKAWIKQIGRDFDTAIELFQQALEANENANAMLWYNMLLSAVDELPQAIRNQRKIVERDPLHAGYKATLASFLLYAGETERALLMAREALALNPRHIFAAYVIIEANTLLGNYAGVEAFISLLSPEVLDWPPIKCRIGIYHAVRGDLDRARQIYRELILNRSSANFPYLAHLALRLGEVEAALDVLERGIAAENWHAFGVRNRHVIRQFDEIDNNSRYLDLLERIGLDDASVAELHEKYSFE